MILASDVLDAIKKEYPVHKITGPDECGEYDIKIGPIRVTISSDEWIASAARELRYYDNGDPSLELLRKFPNDYEMGKAIVSFDKPVNYEKTKCIATVIGCMPMTVKQVGKADCNSLFRFMENFKEPDDIMEIIDSIDELSKIAKIDEAVI